MSGSGVSAYPPGDPELTNRAIVGWSFASGYSVAYHLLMVIVRSASFGGRASPLADELGSSHL